MTKLADQILESALKGTPGWILASRNGDKTNNHGYLSDAPQAHKA